MFFILPEMFRYSHLPKGNFYGYLFRSASSRCLRQNSPLVVLLENAIWPAMFIDEILLNHLSSWIVYIGLEMVTVLYAANAVL